MWLIERFDLIFYNGRHRRWQFFAEDPAASGHPAAAKVAVLNPKGGLHRYQIRSLLATFRKIVQSSVTSHSAKFEIASKSTVSHINIEAPREGWWKKHNKTYLDYLIATAWHDGVIEEHRRTLHRWFENPKTDISRAEAITLLSLLPIFEDWDTWGCVARARRSSSQRLSDAFPPPCAQDWAAPLSVVELDFKGKIGGPSAKLLSGPVDIEAICLDLASPGSTPYPSPRQDFFDQRYCLLPQRSHRIPYRFYATLVDPILTKLAPSQSPDRQFVIAYPLRVAGRLHFLQIALSPPRDEGVDVNALWMQWQDIHTQIWTPPLRAFLREEMQRIVTSAFQHEAHSRLEERVRQGAIPRGDRAKIEAEYKAKLYECLYHLFPVESVTTPDHKYGYRQYFWPENSRTMAVGSKWDNTINKGTRKITGRRLRALEVINEESSSVAENPSTVIVVEDPSSNTVEDLAEDHRVHHAITEQAKFLDRLRESATDIWMDAEDDRRRCARIVRTWAQSKDWKKLQVADLKEEPDVDKEHLPKGREPFSGRYQPRSIKRYIAQMLNLDKDDELMILEGLKSVLRPSLLLQISEYFETGAAKVASHTAYPLYFSQSLEQLKLLDRTHYSAICTHIDKEIGRLSLQSAAKKDLGVFRKTLTDHINCASVRDLTCVENHKEIALAHHDFRVEDIVGIIKNFRCYYIDPVRVLKPFLDWVAVTDQKRYLPDGITVQRLNELYPCEWVPYSEDACVRRVEHFVYFGSSAKAVPQYSRLKSANMLKLWGKNCQALADLLVHTKDSTHVFFDGEFVKDEHLHTELCNHRTGLEQLFSRAVFWVILRMQVWRTIEDQETTKELDVSSFSLETIRGALNARCDC